MICYSLHALETLLSFETLCDVFTAVSNEVLCFLHFPAP